MHVVKCFSCANPNQQVPAWESKLRRIWSCVLCQKDGVMWLISDVSHYHSIRIGRKVETLCQVISNVLILIESWNKGVHIVVMKANCPKIVSTPTYGEFMDITPSLTFTLPSFTWELIANCLMSISPHVQGVTNIHFAYFTANKKNIFLVLRNIIYLIYILNS